MIQFLVLFNILFLLFILLFILFILLLLLLLSFFFLPIDDMPDDRKQLENWLHLSFLQKEEELLQYEATGKLCSEVSKSALVPYEHIYIPGANAMFISMSVLVLFLTLFGWFRWLCSIYIVTCIAMRAFNGFDSVELNLHSSMFVSEMKRRNSSQAHLQNMPVGTSMDSKTK